MTKSITPTPHDRFFRGSLSDPRVAREFMETNLPTHIKALVNLKTLKMCPGTFVDEKLQLHLSDVLFSVRWAGGKPGYVYVLLEHQRNPDPLMPFRNLQYTVKIMDQHYKEHRELPIVYTLVIYHGHKKYPYSTDLFDLFGEHKNIAEKTLLQPFDLLDLSQISDDDLKQQIWSGMMELSLKHISERDLIPFIKGAIQLIKQIEQAGGSEYIRTIFYYFFTTGEIQNVEELKQVIHDQLSPKLENNIMTIADLFRQEGRQEAMALAQQWKEEGIQLGEQRGEQRGKQEGKQEAMEEFALRLVQRSMLDEEIAVLTGLSPDAVRALRAKKNTH
jgi:predicted transposase/invertase (TIGR01784 family)